MPILITFMNDCTPAWQGNVCVGKNSVGWQTHHNGVSFLRANFGRRTEFEKIKILYNEYETDQ